MIKKYKKKPVVIEAIQFDGNNEQECGNFMGDYYLGDNNGKEDQFLIDTLEGKMIASKGDFIIKGVKGEFYPCKPDIFKESYEEVKE